MNILTSPPTDMQELSKNSFSLVRTLRGERVQFLEDVAHRFRPAVQLSITVIGSSSPSGVPRMKRWPSPLTSY